MKYCYDYPRPAVTVDVIILAIREGKLCVLLIQRGRPPFRGRWAIPGGFVEENETLEAAAARELEEETGIRGLPLTQLHTFGDPGRDPRGRTISVAYYVLLDSGGTSAKASDDAAAVGWFSLTALPPLAFDHDRILKHALRQVRREAAESPLLATLLPKRFTLRELEKVLAALDPGQGPKPGLIQALRRRGLVRPVAGKRGVYSFRTRSGG